MSNPSIVCAVKVLWLMILDDHGLCLSNQKMFHANWLVVTFMGVSQRKCFITTHEALLHNMYVKPSLAETQFRVEVRRLKYVKYELDKISSSVDTLPLRWPVRDPVSWTVGVSAHHSKVSGLGILFNNPLKSHTHCLTACVYHFLCGWLLIIGNLGLCWFLPATLGCYSLRSQ